jgi:hypothetical protein
LFWNNLEIPKNNSVASLVGNFSPVKRRTAIFVRRLRHLRGEIGEELKRRAEFGLVIAVDQYTGVAHHLGRRRYDPA